MQILDIQENNLKVAANFQYKGFTVSFSSIMKGWSVMAWNDQGMELFGNSVEDVLNKINKLF